MLLDKTATGTRFNKQA